MTQWLDIADGGRAALANALSMIESDPLTPSSCALLDQAWEKGTGHVVGLTGSPGAGKSTLIGALLTPLSQAGHSVAVLAVDPSSQASGGALLGDRIRFDADPDSDKIFIRSMAARNHLGGVAATTMPAAVLLRALYDWVIVETVGVGQSETAIVSLADTIVLCAVPGAGDTLQWMKSGIAEIPDIIAITKSDQQTVAQKALADVRAGLALGLDEDGRSPIALALSARNGDGVPELIQAMEDHCTAGAKNRSWQREQGLNQWARVLIQNRFGEHGLAQRQPKLSGRLSAPAPFTHIATLMKNAPMEDTPMEDATDDS